MQKEMWPGVYADYQVVEELPPKRKRIRWQLPLAVAFVAAMAFAIGFKAGWFDQPPTPVLVGFGIALYLLTWPANRAVFKALTGRASEEEVEQLRSRARRSWGRAD